MKLVLLRVAMLLALCGYGSSVSSAHADILSAIAQCESSGHQFDADGNVLRNPDNYYVVGLYQINERLHGKVARRLGFNIYTVLGNRAYARYLLHTQGTAPWLASKHCWKRIASR